MDVRPAGPVCFTETVFPPGGAPLRRCWPSSTEGGSPVARANGRRVASRRRSRRALAQTVVPGIGLVALLGAAFAAVADSSSELPDQKAAAATVLSAATTPKSVSRDAERPPLPNETKAGAKVKGVMYATVKLPVYADSTPSSPELALLAAGDKVDVTGTKKGDWTQIMHNGAPRWVATDGLTKEEPLGSAPCRLGSGVERGLQPDTVKVYRAVCAKFPQVVRYGGVAGRGEHATGHSLDIMIRSDVGTEIAAFLQKNRSELGVEYLIWRQRIWRPATSGAWRHMSSRGSATANHMDHVHVTTYGNAATK